MRRSRSVFVKGRPFTMEKSGMEKAKSAITSVRNLFFLFIQGCFLYESCKNTELFWNNKQIAYCLKISKVLSWFNLMMVEHLGLAKLS